MTEVVDGVLVSSFEKEMRGSYLSYAMSTIVARALPDVRDGLKPVHRRILHAMNELKLRPSAGYRKSAGVVGEVMGKYHPHGDSSIYEAMVRMAQWWSLRYPLVDGQGNFGNLDGDGAAAMRYTEAKMDPLTMELVGDLEKNVVPMRQNYDGRELEPTVLPAAFPNLLVNGVTGIAVGMATEMPTHNLREVIAATLLFLDRTEVSVAEVMEVMPGPDFPTSGVIYGRAGIRKAYETGRGIIVMSGVAVVEEGKGGRQSVVIKELPYRVVRKGFVEKLGTLVATAAMQEKAKKENVKKEMSPEMVVLRGISDIRDESNRNEPVKIVVELRKDADAEIVINTLRKLTEFQTTFPYNATCLDAKGRPSEMGVVQILREFVTFRRQVVRSRIQFDLDKARGEQSRQIGLYAAVIDIDEVVRIIRGAADVDDARARLLSKDFRVDDDLRRIVLEADPDAEVGETFRLIDSQVEAILGMSLRKLTGLERRNIVSEAMALAVRIRELVEILISPTRIDGIIRNELEAIAAKHGDDRRTVIEASEADLLDMEDMIEKKDVVVTLTSTGYVKRTDLAAYRAQGRGGKGRSGMETKEDDFVVRTLVCHSKSPLLVFTNLGRVYGIKAYRLFDAPINGRGRPIVNYVDFQDGESVADIVALPDDHDEDVALVFVTDAGNVRRNSMSDFSSIKRDGKLAMRLEDGTRLVSVFVAGHDDNVLIATAKGMSVRFPATNVRVFGGRESMGVRGIDLKAGDRVISASVLRNFDATAIERRVYLAGGVVTMSQGDLSEADRREFPSTLSTTPRPSDERPDGIEVAMAGEAMRAFRESEIMLLSISAFGFGKRSSSHEFRCMNRGVAGVTPCTINEKTGDLVALMPVEPEDGLMLVTDQGQIIRIRVGDVSVMGRNTQGVRVFRLEGDQRIVSVARIPAGEAEADDGTAGAPAPVPAVVGHDAGAATPATNENEGISE